MVLAARQAALGTIWQAAEIMQVSTMAGPVVANGPAHLDRPRAWAASHGAGRDGR